jgi:DNA-binding transcriptional MerR regulator
MCARFRDPAAQNYAIGDFAKKAGVSTHFLKFYEEKGILHPRVQENGYRYYDIRDASLVLECFRMKNMGLSVRQIEKGINDCTEQEVAEMLQQRENVLQSQLHEQQMHLQGLQNLRVALRLCEQGEWSVRTVPDVWYLPHTIGKEFVQDSRIYDQLPQWLDWMPVVTSAQIARGNDAHAERMEWGLGLEQVEAAQLGFAPQEPAQLLHLGRVLEIYCSWEIPAEHGSEKGLYQYCMERARALNLVPEPVMFRRVFCYTEKGGTKQVHNVLRVPVKMAE